MALTLLLYHAGKLRANFAFDDLNTVLTTSALATAASPHRDEPVVLALRSFAAFGSRALTTEHARGLLDRAWTAPHRSRHVVDVCLNGLAFSVPFDGQGELLRRLAQEAVETHPDDHMFRFRLATAHHLCADHDEALSHIDAALALLARHPLILRGYPRLQPGRETHPRPGGAQRRSALRLRCDGQTGRFWPSMYCRMTVSGAPPHEPAK